MSVLDQARHAGARRRAGSAWEVFAFLGHRIHEMDVGVDHSWKDEEAVGILDLLCGLPLRSDRCDLSLADVDVRPPSTARRDHNPVLDADLKRWAHALTGDESTAVQTSRTLRTSPA